jgi:hypothetical protein
MSRYRKRRTRKSSLETFDPNDRTHVKHTRVGVWDIYEEREPIVRIPGLSAHLKAYREIANCLPYLWRMMKDISTINGCIALIALYVVVEIVASLVPALSLW